MLGHNRKSAGVELLAGFICQEMWLAGSAMVTH